MRAAMRPGLRARRRVFISDSFNRANANLGSTPDGRSYTLSGTTAVVASNQLTTSPATSSSGATVLLDPGTTAQSVDYDCVSNPAFSDGTVYITIWLRWTSATDRILAQWSKPSGSNWQASLYVYPSSSTPTLLTTNVGGSTFPSHVRAEVTAGGLITATFTPIGGGANWVVSATNNTRTGTKCGLQVDGGAVLDNLTVVGIP